MKYMIYLLLVCCFLFSCYENNETSPAIETSYFEIKTPLTEKTNPISNFDLEKHLKNYDNLKKQIAHNKKSLSDKSNRTSTEVEAKEYISKILIDSIFNYWEGTPWDFNGHTNQPREGEVACGYFISTTLKHIGCKLNRYKLAQKSASEIINDICGNSSKRFTDFNKLKTHLLSIDEYELLVIGLDFHVGFIYKKNGQVYFAHSNYINREGVIKEKIENSIALKSSKTYLIGSLTKNSDFARSWLRE